MSKHDAREIARQWLAVLPHFSALSANRVSLDVLNLVLGFVAARLASETSEATLDSATRQLLEERFFDEGRLDAAEAIAWARRLEALDRRLAQDARLNMPDIVEAFIERLIAEDAITGEGVSNA